MFLHCVCHPRSSGFTRLSLLKASFLPVVAYPVAALQKWYKYLHVLLLPPVDHAQPLLLIGSDMPHLLIPVQPIHAGPPGGPIVVCTPLGCKKAASHSKWDQQAMTLLQASTTRVEVQRSATPLLQRAYAPPLHAPKAAMLPCLQSIERRLADDPRRAEVYCN